MKIGHLHTFDGFNSTQPNFIGLLANQGHRPTNAFKVFIISSSHISKLVVSASLRWLALKRMFFAFEITIPTLMPKFKSN